MLIIYFWFTLQDEYFLKGMVHMITIFVPIVVIGAGDYCGDPETTNIPSLPSKNYSYPHKKLHVQQGAQSVQQYLVPLLNVYHTGLHQITKFAFVYPFFHFKFLHCLDFCCCCILMVSWERPSHYTSIDKLGDVRFHVWPAGSDFRVSRGQEAVSRTGRARYSFQWDRF